MSLIREEQRTARVFARIEPSHNITKAKGVLKITATKEFDPKAVITINVSKIFIYEAICTRLCMVWIHLLRRRQRMVDSYFIEFRNTR